MKRLVLVLIILVSCVGCDQSTKSVAKTYLSETNTISLLGDAVRLQIAKNYGVFLNAGATLPSQWRSKLFSIGLATILISLLVYAMASKRLNPIAIAATGLIAGGGVSNMIDRVLYGGYVVDFLNIGIGPVRTGIFNWADMCIMSGVALWIFGDRIWRSIAVNGALWRVLQHLSH